MNKITLTLTLNVNEGKPTIVNHQCVVYSVQCDLSDAGYVGYALGHLHNRGQGRKQCYVIWDRNRGYYMATPSTRP